MNYCNALEDCSTEYNKIILCEEKGIKIIGKNEDEEEYKQKRNELLKVSSYIEYSKHTYDDKFKAYTVYKIIDKCIDQNNNLLLFYNQVEHVNKQ